MANNNRDTTKKSGNTKDSLYRKDGKLRFIETVPIGETKVQFIDGGNVGGIAIKIDFPDGRKPTQEELAILKLHIKGQIDEKTGFHWNAPTKSWKKQIGQDSSAARAVAIRIDAANRMELIVEDLKKHYNNTETFTQRLQQSREQEETPDKPNFK